MGHRVAARGPTVDALVTANGLANCATIWPGQTLNQVAAAGTVDSEIARGG